MNIWNWFCIDNKFSIVDGARALIRNKLELFLRQAETFFAMSRHVALMSPLKVRSWLSYLHNLHLVFLEK